MATITYIKYQNNNSENQKAYKKWYGRLVHRETLQTNDLCRHIQTHGSIYTGDVVKGVMDRFATCLNELLLEGYKVKIDGLGTFYLASTTTGAAKEDDFSAKNFTKLRVRFLPDGGKESEFKTLLMTSKAKLTEYKNIEPGSTTTSGSSTGGSDSDTPPAVDPD